MREIKFRGLNTADGSEGMTTFTLGELLATSEDYDLVDPDTVQQLVGYDQDGKEVYEGDVLLSNYPDNDKEYVARLHGEARTTDGYIIFQKMFGNFRLKEDLK